MSLKDPCRIDAGPAPQVHSVKSEQTADKDRKQIFYTLDAMRGAASLLVVERHVNTYYGFDQFYYGYLAVDLFFLMSGFVLEHTYGKRLDDGFGAIRFTWVRIVRLHPIYIASLAVSAVAYLLNSNGGLEFAQINSLAIAIALGALMLPFLTVPPGLYPLNGPAWTLATEFAVNVVYGAIHRRLSGRLIAVICVASGLALVGLAVNAPRGLDYGWSPKTLPIAFVRVTFSFFLGVAIYRLFRFGNRQGHVSTSDGIALVVLSAAIGAMLIPEHILQRNIYDLIVVAVIFPSAVYFGAAFNPGKTIGHIFRSAGLVSYAIYVFHVPLSNLILAILDRYSMIDLSQRQPVAGWLFLAFLVLFSWIVDRMYDAPVRRWMIAVSRPWWRKSRPV